MRERVLIIDDDIQIGDLEQEILEGEGYRCSRAFSGTEALLLLEKNQPELVLLDLMLPGLSGEEVLKRISDIPVIVVSAKAGMDDKVSLLLGGAADYITKPFHVQELLARVKVALRKKTASSAQLCRFSDIVMNHTSHTVTVSDTPVSLTKTEYAILRLLMQNHDQVIARSVILDRIGEDTLDCTESSLKTHISHLRSKLRQVGGKEYIEAVWGIGFRLTEL